MALKAVMKTHTRCIIICNAEMKMEYYCIKLTAKVQMVHMDVGAGKFEMLGAKKQPTLIVVQYI